MITREHQEFYNHLKHGGKVWRNDPLNNRKEVLYADHPKLKGNLSKIGNFGYNDLMVVEKEYEHLFPIYD